MDYVYAARFEADPDGGFLVTFPDVPEAIASGPDRTAAARVAGEVLGLALRGYLARGLPLPRARSKGTVVPVEADDAMKLALIEAFNAAGISKSELARRLGKVESEARRILDPDHPTKMPAMRDALAALGKTVVVSVRDAA